MQPGSLPEALGETLALFDESGTPQTTTEVAECLDLGRRGTYSRLKRLVEEGHLETKKVGANARVWWHPQISTRDEILELPFATDSLIGDVLDDIDVGIFVLDADFDVVWANSAVESYFGLDRGDVVGRDKRVVVDDQVAPIVENSDQFRDRTVSTYETNVHTQSFECHVTPADDRAERWLEHWSKPIESGEFAGGRVETYYDITERKQSKQSLKEAHEELESNLADVFNRVSDGFYGLDSDFRFSFVNDRAEELFELEGSSVVEKDIRTELALSGHLEEALHRALDEQEPVSIEDYYAPVGAWLESHIYPSNSGLSVYIRDITDRKERERVLEQYEKIVETVDDGIYVLDEDNRFEMVNSGFSSMTGYSPDELLDAPAELVFGDKFVDIANQKQAELEAGEQSVAVVDEEIFPSSDDAIDVESRFSLIQLDDDQTGRVGVVRDITKRKVRERKLEETKRRYQTLVDNFPNGAVALVDEDLRYITFGGEPVTEMAIDGDELAGKLLREVLPEEAIDIFAPHYEAALDGETSSFTESIGDRCYQFRFLPVRDDSGDVFAAMGMSQDITKSKRREEGLIQQREQLSVLNSFNELVRDVNSAVIERSARQDIEQVVCDSLVETDSYQFAWIGDVDPQTQLVKLRAEAGVEGYLKDTEISVDADDELSSGPTGSALRTRSVQVEQEVDSEQYGPWREYVKSRGIETTASIPLTHEGTVYGVLNLYTKRTQAIEGAELEVMSQLGDIVGHAIAAADRKQALINDEFVEIGLEVEDAFDMLDVGSEITMEHQITLENGKYLIYGTAPQSAIDTFETLVETNPAWDSLTVYSETDPVNFELKVNDSPVFSTIQSFGGRVEGAVVEEGDLRVTVSLPSSTDVRQFVDEIQEIYPQVEMLRRRQSSRSQDGSERGVIAELTDQQRSTIEAAYHAGFFEWPRETSGEDVAESMGISAPTFHQHLRKVERKVFDSLLGPQETHAVE